jgi:hypothetical protein
MNTNSIRKTAAVLVAGIALTAAGCGSDSDDAANSDDPTEVVSALYAAAGDGDAEAMCNLMSADAQENAAAEEDADSCEQGIEKSLSGGAGDLLSSIEVGEAEIDGDSGTVEISAFDQTDTVNVVQEDGQWKVDEDS